MIAKQIDICSKKDTNGNVKQKYIYAKRDEKRKNERKKNQITHRSVVDLTSSRFHNPHVSCRAVDANSRQLITSSKPIGPKKYVKISISPEKCKKTGFKLVNFSSAPHLPF